MSRNLISLFAGCGGLDLGLEKAGFKTVAANELEPHACESLRLNQELAKLPYKDIPSFVEQVSSQRCFAKVSQEEKARFFSRLLTQSRDSKCLANCAVIEGDIRKITSDQFLSHVPNNELFCIAGGPPCQPFSKAGKRKTIDCTKNGDLFFEFVRLVKDLRPKWFLFENVKGLAFTKTDIINQLCSDCGSERLADFRVRQNFEEEKKFACCDQCGSKRIKWDVLSERGGSLRIILNEFEKTGYRCDFKVLNAADFGVPQIRERLFIVGSRDGKEINWPKPTHSKPTHSKPKNSQQAELFEEEPDKSAPWVSMRDTVFNKPHWKYGKLTENDCVLWVKNVVRPHDEPVTWSLDRPSPTIGAHQGAKLAIAPSGVPEAQLARQQWATQGKRQGDTPPVPVEHEYLSDQELLELQSFPSWWYLHGTRMQRAFQIGNAVPPKLAEVVGRAILEVEDNGSQNA